MESIPIILTVRFKSSRLPGKCLLPFSSKIEHHESVLEHVIKRAHSNSRQLIVCTGDGHENSPIIETCKLMKVDYFQGNERNKINRWFDCFNHYNLKFAHMLDVDDPFFCNDEIAESIKKFQQNNFLVASTTKSKSGNASVGITLGVNQIKKMYGKVKNEIEFEMVEELISKLFAGEIDTINSLDPIPPETRLTLDYFEDYLALSLIKINLSTYASRNQIHEFLKNNSWILNINSQKNTEWKNRQKNILERQRFHGE